MKLYREVSSIAKLISLFYLAVLYGCTGGATSTGSGSSALLQGNVASSSLQGDRSNIEVAVRSQKTRTDAQGNFTLANIPSGQQTVTFSKGGQTAGLSVNVPPDGIIKLLNVRIIGPGESATQALSGASRASTIRVEYDHEPDDNEAYSDKRERDDD